MWKPRGATLEAGIRETLAYFSLFSYPMTPLELWRLLFISTSYEALCAVLLELVASGAVIERHGKYTLFQNVRGFFERELRYRSALRKLRRARRAAYWLSHLPWVRAVFVCNSLGLMHTRDGSDIDFFIVAEPGTLWRTRFFSVLPYLVSGLRPSMRRERDTLCFSFFLSTDRLDLRSFKISEEDPYLAFWAVSLLPLYDPDMLLGELWKQSGCFSLFPQLKWFLPLPVGKKPLRALWRFCFPSAILESLFRAVQYRRFPEAVRLRMNQDTAVVVGDEVIKLHTNDDRDAIRERYAAGIIRQTSS